MNQNIVRISHQPGKRTVKVVSEKELWVFKAILFGAVSYGGGGKRLWDTGSEATHGIGGAPNFFAKYGMKLYRFQQIKEYFPWYFTHPSVTEANDPWFMISSFVNAFNKNRQRTVAASRRKTPDELMSSWKPRTTKLGGLPNISFILRKPKPLGTEFKAMACAKRRIMLHLEIQRGKDGMKPTKYFKEFGATAACTLRMVEATQGCGRNPEDVLPSTISADSWFASKKTAEQILGLGHEFCGPVKTAHTGVPKKQIEDLMEDWPGGTYVVFEAGDLIVVGYKYNSRKVLVFIMTKNAGSTKPGTVYQARFSDTHGNTRTRDVTRPQVLSDYFKDCNAIDIHNQVRQDHLGLEQVRHSHLYC